MTALDAFTKRIFEIHEGSVKYVLGLQDINSNVSRLGRVLTQIYTVGIDAVNAMMKAMTMLGRRMQGLLITRLVSDLLPLLRPILDIWSTGIGEAVVSDLEPLKVSIFGRFTPPTDVIARVIGSLTGESRKLSIPTYEDIATIPPIPLVTPPPTLELMETVNAHINRISEVGRKVYETAPAMTVGVGIDYGSMRVRATRGIFDILRRGVEEVYGVEALEVTPSRLGIIDTIQEVYEKFAAPASILVPPISHARRYVIDVSEAYNSRVLEPISKVHEVSSFIGMIPIPPIAREIPDIEIAKAGGLVLTIPDMEKGLQLISKGEARAYTMAFPGVAPTPTEVVEGRVAEAPLRVVIKYAPQIKSIDTLGYDLAKRVADMRAIIPPRIETRLVDTFQEVKRRAIDAVSQKISEVYLVGTGAPVMWTPSILEIAKVAGDHIGRISSTILKGAMTYRLGASTRPSVMEAMETAPSVPSISEFTGKVPSLRTPVVEKAVVSKHVLAIPEVERVFRLIAEKVAETYRLGVVSIIPPPIEAVADGVAKVSDFGIRMRVLDRGFDLMEGGVKGLSTAAQSVMHPPSSVEMEQMVNGYVGTVSEMSRALDAFGAVSKEFMTKASGFDIVKAQQLYPAAEVMEAVGSLSGAVSKVSGQYPSMVMERYLEVARASPVREYLTMGTRLGVVSELGSGLDLMGGGGEELSMVASIVASPPSFVDLARIVSGHVSAVSEITRALDKSGIFSREIMDYRVGMEEAIKSSIGGVIVSLLRAQVGRYTLERVPLEAPMSVPTVKLHEIIPLLSSVRTPTKTERPTTVRRDRSIARSRPIEVKVESFKGEIDMRELRRKIARILREEARRHGVF